MAIFVIIPTGQTEMLANAIQTAFGSKAYKLPSGEWLVSHTGTSRSLSDDLKITPAGEPGGAVVMSVSGYYGRAPTDVWEWIKQNWGA